MRKILYALIAVWFVACTQPEQASTDNEETISYNEPHRPQFHFSQPAHWMNDPNGMVYLDGEHHLFYQYYPDSTVWGPMHWGHAVTKDLIHWENLPVALFPDSLGYIFSGSAVYDHNNSSGLGTTDTPPLVAIYTYHDPIGAANGSEVYQTQGIAFSTDKGRTWTKYDKNPVLPNPGIIDFRDPKVFWMENENKWLMALAVKDHIRFYSSQNLIDWNLESEFGKTLGGHGGVWECPDLFMLDDQWVLFVSINPGGPNKGSATQYFVGDFDGKTFVPHDTTTRWLDYGRDNYAGVTWSNIPNEDGRKIFLGWMSNWDYGQAVPTEKWRSAMTVSRMLSLEKENNGFIVKSFPVKEVDNLRGSSQSIPKTNASEVSLNTNNFTLYDLTINLSSAEELGAFEIQLFNDDGDTLFLGQNPSASIFYINRDKAGDHTFSKNFDGLQKAPVVSGKQMSLRLLVDVSSVEVFVNDGQRVMTALFFPHAPFSHARLINKSQKNIDVEGTIYEMKRIWK